MKKIFISIFLVALTLISGACGDENNGWTAEEKSTLTYLISLHDPWLKGEALKRTVEHTTEQYSYGEYMAELYRINSE